MIAIGGVAFLKAEKKWTAPSLLTVTLALYALAHLSLMFLLLVPGYYIAEPSATSNAYYGPAIFLTLAAGGYLFYAVVVKKRV